MNNLYLDSKSIITILDGAMTPFLKLSKFRFNYLITNPGNFIDSLLEVLFFVIQIKNSG